MIRPAGEPRTSPSPTFRLRAARRGDPGYRVAGAAALGYILGLLSRRWLESSGPREERFHALVQSSPDIVVIAGADGNVTYASPSVYRTLGYGPGELVGARLSQHLHRKGIGQEASGVDPAPVEMFRMLQADGSWRYFEAVSADLPGTDRAYYLRDLAGRKALEGDLVHRAFHDPLTGLANRDLFLDRLEHALLRSHRQQRSIAVVFLDLDDFKAVNDGLGHVAGDRLLATVGQRLAACSRSVDTAARLGGDEFAVILEDTATLREANLAAERITERLRAPVTLSGHTLSVATSHGLAMSGSGRRPEDLLRAADAAMYRAKERKGKPQGLRRRRKKRGLPSAPSNGRSIER